MCAQLNICNSVCYFIIDLCLPALSADRQEGLQTLHYEQKYEPPGPPLLPHLPPLHRIADHQEGLQILHYEHGQKYEPHFDYFHDAVNASPERGGQRVATLLMYLSTPEEGGETVFPNAASKDKVAGGEWSECANKGLAVKTFKGDALLFYR